MAKEYFVKLDGEFAEGKAAATVYEAAHPAEGHHIHLIEHSAYADVLARLALLKAQLAQLLGDIEVPGIPDPCGGIVEPNV